MPISFNSIPSNLRIPFTYVEFNNANAVSAAGVQPIKILVMGQRLSSGTAAALTPTRVTSGDDAGVAFGVGSFIHNMVRTLCLNDKLHEITVMGINDVSGGTAAAGSVAFGGTVAAGTIYLWIAGQLVQVGVSAGQTLAQVATAAAAAINAVTSLPVTAAVDGSITTQVNLTCRHKGTLGNKIDVRVNYADGESLPTGLTVTIVAMASGATDPDVAGIISALPDTQFNLVVCPWIDSTNLGKVTTELADRWGPIKQSDGVAIVCKDDTYSNLATFGLALNSPHLVAVGHQGSPTPPWEVAAAVAGQVAASIQNDPARPFQTLPLSGVLAPAEASRLDFTERNLLLYDGVATLNVDHAGVVRIERLITTYQTNGSGAADTSYLDLTTVTNLSYLRWDFRTYFQGKYGRHKLADDGTRFGPGQAIITPKIGRAEAISKFVQWEALGLVEDVDQFKADLIVERNSQDPTRLDFMLPPNLVNPLVVAAAQIAFKL